MTAASIARHAAVQPNAVAIINAGRAMSYGELDDMVARFAQGLAQFGLARGALVALECRDNFLHLLLMLACDRLGLCSVSYIAAELQSPLPILAQADLVLSEHAVDGHRVRRRAALSVDWLARVSTTEVDAAPAPAPSPAGVYRILRTSGTTGTPKTMLLHRGVHERRVASWMQIYGAAPGHRFLNTMPFTLHAMTNMAGAAFAAGATLVFETRGGLTESVAALGITHAALMPVQLQAVVDRLPHDFAKPPLFVTSTFGGPVAADLRQRALDRLATRLVEVYSGNEAGNIALSEDPWRIATVLPDVDVEIVDEQGGALPRGETGWIKARTPYMADGYAGDAETTARMFRGGWFISGDMGVLHGDGRLEMVGRADEIVNLGGIKVALARLEERLRAGAGNAVHDLGVCVLPDGRGIDRLYVAVCSDTPDDDALAARLRPAFAGFPFGDPVLVRLDRIPRTESGKIQREPLRRAVAEAVAGGRAIPTPLDSKPGAGEDSPG